MQPLPPKAEDVFGRIDDTLTTARHGLDDLLGSDLTRRMSGLRNLIVFGRSVTFVIQNLRSVFPDEFDTWYQAEQELLRQDPLARYFVEARNALEKQGKLSVGTSAFISSFSGTDIRKFGPPPAGAKSFFIGDSLGGSGWEVELSEGNTEKYYVNLPASIGTVTQHFTNLPAALDPSLRDAPIDELCQRYVDMLSQLVERAISRFHPMKQRVPAATEAQSHLRRVK